MLINSRSVIDDCSVKCVGSLIDWYRENSEQIDSIFLTELLLFKFRSKSSVNITSFIPISTARPIESSMFEKR